MALVDDDPLYPTAEHVPVRDEIRAHVVVGADDDQQGVSRLPVMLQYVVDLAQLEPLDVVVEKCVEQGD
jgi:hypothetical protein